MILLEREGEKINKIVLGKDFEVETLERINADYFDNNSLLKSKFQYNMQDRPEVFVNPIQGESSIPIVETITFNTSKYATYRIYSNYKGFYKTNNRTGAEQFYKPTQPSKSIYLQTEQPQSRI